MMLIAEVLHPLVPSLVVPEVDELLEQNGSVLTGNRGNASVRSAQALAPVAGGARLEENRSVCGVGRQPRSLHKLLPRVVSLIGTGGHVRTHNHRGEQ
jgi:hypothetical protein